MPHPLRSPGALLSLVLFLALAALCLRSFLPESLLWESRGGRLLLIADNRSAVALRQARETQTLDGFLADRLNPRFYPTPPAEFRLLGFYYAHGTNPWDGAFYVFGVPYWFLLPLAALPLVLHLRRHRRAAGPHSATLCPACGYDCRGTPDRCPECGAIPARFGGGKPRANQFAHAAQGAAESRPPVTPRAAVPTLPHSPPPR